MAGGQIELKRWDFIPVNFCLLGEGNPMGNLNLDPEVFFVSLQNNVWNKIVRTLIPIR